MVVPVVLTRDFRLVNVKSGKVEVATEVATAQASLSTQTRREGRRPATVRRVIMTRHPTCLLRTDGALGREPARHAPIGVGAGRAAPSTRPLGPPIMSKA